MLKAVFISPSATPTGSWPWQVARSPQLWKAVRDRLAPAAQEGMPNKPPPAPYEAWCALHEALWVNRRLRQQAGRCVARTLKEYTRDNITILTETTAIGIKRYGVSLTEPVQGADGEIGVVGDGIADLQHGPAPYGYAVSPKARRRRGVAIFGNKGGDATWLALHKTDEPQAKDWRDTFIDRLIYAKARILEYKSWPKSQRTHSSSPTRRWPYHGAHPLRQFPRMPEMFFRNLSGRAHPADVLEDAQEIAQFRKQSIPEWASSEQVAAFLLHEMSFETGGAGQVSAGQIRKWLSSRDRLAIAIRERAEAFASEYTERNARKAMTVPTARAVTMLSSMLQLADAVQGSTRHERDRVKARIADLKRAIANGGIEKSKVRREALAFYRLLDLNHRRGPMQTRNWDQIDADPRLSNWQIDLAIEIQRDVFR